MARRMKKADAKPAASEITAGDLKRGIEEYERQVSNASEYQGLAGQAIKTMIERHHLNRKALRVILAANKMELQKRQAFYRQVLELAHKAGHFDQTDAFDDILDRMEEIVSEVRERGEGGRPAQDSVVTSLIQ